MTTAPAPSFPAVRVKLFLLLFLALFVALLYTTLHEGGHALVGLASGQTLTEFNVNFFDLSAHVNLLGELTFAQRALQAAAGVSLPLLVWVLFIYGVPRRAGLAVELLKCVASLVTLSTLLAWIILPFFYASGSAPSDDSINFLSFTGLPPLILSAVALGLYAGGWAVFLARIRGLRDEIRFIKAADLAVERPDLRRSLLVMGSVLVLDLALVLAAGLASGANPAQPIIVPAAYRPVNTLDLSYHAYQADTVGWFTLDQPTDAGVFVTLSQINTPYFDLVLTGPNGFQAAVLHAEGYSASQDSASLEKRMEPGQYWLLLTADQSPGLVTLYVKDR